MRKALALAILMVTALSGMIASATALRVDGGTIQVFSHDVKMPVVDARPKLLFTATPTLETVRLEYEKIGAVCQDGYLLFAETINTGPSLPDTFIIRILRGEETIAERPYPALPQGVRARLEMPVREAGVYRFLIFQPPGLKEEEVFFSLEITVDSSQCPLPTAAMATATTVPLTLETVIPTATAAASTEIPSAAPPTTIPPIETATVELPTPSPTIEASIAVPPTEVPMPSLEPSAEPVEPVQPTPDPVPTLAP